MLELEREAAATTKISTQEALFVILITQHAPFSRKGLLMPVMVRVEKFGILGYQPRPPVEPELFNFPIHRQKLQIPLTHTSALSHYEHITCH